MKFECFSATTIGDSHIRKGIPREDNAGDFCTEAYQLMAVSDGHGDPNCFRSAKGSEIAVRVTLDGLRSFAEHFLYDHAFRKNLEVSKYRDEAIDRLIKGLEAQWILEVRNDLEKNPIDFESETANCDSEQIERYKNGNRLNNIYGTTLIGAAVFDNILLVIQLGDGKVVFLGQDGKFTQPVPPDPKCFLNVTTSLCNENALQSFRSLFFDYGQAEKPPIGVFITTDGIEDSYRTDDLMYCFHRDVCIHAVEKGIGPTKALYEGEVLGKISRYGSGDDMSVAAFMDIESIKEFIPEMKKENLRLTLQENAQYYSDHMQSMDKKYNYLKNDYEESVKDLNALQQTVDEKKEKFEEYKHRYLEYQSNYESAIEELKNI